MNGDFGVRIGLQQGFHCQAIHKGEIPANPDEMEMMGNQESLRYGCRAENPI